MPFNNILTYLLYPINAIVSRKFYLKVIFDMKGVGLVYLLALCTALAFPASFQVKNVLAKFNTLDLPSAVAQIPASTISSEGVLSPDNPNDTKPLIIYNKHNEAVIYYNLENELVEGVTETPPITLTSHAALIKSAHGTINVPWTSIYGNNGAKFEPLQAANVLEQAFTASFLTVWAVVSVWFLSNLSFIVLIASALIKLANNYITRVRIKISLAFRIGAFGSTLVGFFILGQFYFNFSLSFVVMCLVPVVYSMVGLHYFRIIFRQAINDPYFALSKNNPFFFLFDYQSRIDKDQNYDDGPSFQMLNEEQKLVRINNLTRNIKAGIDLSQNRDDIKDHIARHRASSFDKQGQDPNPSKNTGAPTDKDPYTFDDNAGMDDPIFKESQNSANNESSVQSGKKGEDSRFTP